MGVRAADVNYKMAEALATMVRQTGAAVVMARFEDRGLSAEERVRLANTEQPDLYLAFRTVRQAGNPYLAYNIGSSAGLALAGAIDSAMQKQNLFHPEIRAWSDFILQQTPCPALVAALWNLEDSALWYQNQSLAGSAAPVQAVYHGLARYLARRKNIPVAWETLTVTTGATGPETANRRLLVDEYLWVEPEANGRYTFQVPKKEEHSLGFYQNGREIYRQSVVFRVPGGLSIQLPGSK
jgi:hypothetical protein